MRRLPPFIFLAATAACLPGAITHFSSTVTQVATCDIRAGDHYCHDPGDAGLSIDGIISVDEREDSTRVFFRQEVMPGTFDGDHLDVALTRDSIRAQSGCLTRQELHLVGLIDDPGLGIRKELRGVFEESNTAEGDPQQCGRNVPYGELRRYQVVGVETSQP